MVGHYHRAIRLNFFAVKGIVLILDHPTSIFCRELNLDNFIILAVLCQNSGLKRLLKQAQFVHPVEPELARAFARIEQVRVRIKPRLLADNGSSFLHADFQAYLKRAKMPHVRTSPHHTTTQGKIERFHLSSKNRLLLNIYATPERLQQAIGEWVEHYNHVRYHEALKNVTPADMYYGRQQHILTRREQLKRDTIARRKVLASTSANR